MGHLGRFTKTPYLVLFILLGAVGVGTASALMTITLTGNVVITDDLTVDSSTLVVDSANDKVGIGTTSPSEELEVNGQILGDPIVGKWRPDSTTTNISSEYVKWDIEDFNTDPTYFGFTAGQDHIKILKSGTYQITANVLTFSGALGEAMAWELLRTSSSSVDQEYLCRNLATLAGAFYQSSCTTIGTFASNERVRLRDGSSVNSIFGSMDGGGMLPGHNGFTSLVIERLN